MRLERKGLLVGFFVLFLSIFLSFGGVWLFSNFYIYPFLESDVQKITADPLMIMSFLVGASMGMLIIAPINVASRLLFSKELKVKIIFMFMLSIGVIGSGMNISLFQLIIKPNNMIECPKKIGYKKNIMRDYVRDISQCEKF